MNPPALFVGLDLADAGVVIETLRGAAAANRSAACRRGSIDLIHPPGRLIATGDLHDNPLHLARLVEAAGVGEAGITPRAHLTLHEIIHPDKLVNGMDFSYRALTRVAALKASHPEHVHTLLANHELAQVLGTGIVKDGVKVVEAFNEGVEYVFGEATRGVLAAVVEFVRSMPLALMVEREPRAQARSEGPTVGQPADSELALRASSRPILCAHSLPSPELMDRFDPAILERDLTEEDYVPRRGSAHLMVWGRGHTAEQLQALGAQWGVGLFILGHEKAESGAMAIEPNAIVLNSDHERGVYLPIDLSESVPGPAEAAAMVKRLQLEQ